MNEIIIVKYNPVKKFLLLVVPYALFQLMSLSFAFFFIDSNIVVSTISFIVFFLSIYLLIKEMKIDGFYFYSDKIIQKSNLIDPIEIDYKESEFSVLSRGGKYFFSFIIEEKDKDTNTRRLKFSNKKIIKEIIINRNLINKEDEKNIIILLSNVFLKDIKKEMTAHNYLKYIK